MTLGLSKARCSVTPKRPGQSVNDVFGSQYGSLCMTSSGVLCGQSAVTDPFY